jgi:enolase
MSAAIVGVHGRQVLDCRGAPTLEVQVRLDPGCLWAGGRARRPEGPTGVRESLEWRDGDRRFRGRGVRTAVRHIREDIAGALHGQDASEQAAIDQLLIELDGTPEKHRLGANALLGASLACAHAAAAHEGVALWRHLAPVGAQAGQIKGGSPMPRRAHRQYSRLLRIEEQTATTRCMSVAARSGQRVSRRQQPVARQ